MNTTHSLTQPLHVTMSRVYLALAIIGVIIPYYFGFLIFRETGTFDIIDFIRDSTANNSARFLAGDLSITVLTAIVFMIYEGTTKKIKYWWIGIAGIFLVGASFGLPLFLYLREKSLLTHEVFPQG